MSDSGAGGSRGRQRAAALAMVILLGASAVVAGVGTAAAGSTAETTADESNPIKVVYVGGGTGNVTFLRADGAKIVTNVSDVEVVGPMTDLDSDGVLEAPYVTSQGKLRTVDANNETRTLTSGIPYSSTKIGVGDWTNDGEPEVLYPGSSNDYVHYVNVSGTPTQVAQQKASAVLGVANFDGAGKQEIVFVGGSQMLHYYNTSGVTETSYGNFGNSGSSGMPADFYQNGTLWIPAIDGSGYPEVVNASGTVNELRSNSNNTKKTPVAGVDWVTGGNLELVHVQNSELAYTHTNGTVRKIQNSNGNTIRAETVGVARVASYPSNLSVNDFEANATGDQNVTVNVTTNHDLSALNVTLSGPENATLTLGDFEETGTNPYSYTATYDGSADGEYTATVERAASAGDSVSSAATDTASVDEVVPVLNSVNLTDATDGDGRVEPGDTIEVTANATGDVGTVTANLSAFDAGSNVTLSHEGSDTYNWTGVVGENASAGNQSVNVTVSDGQGNTVSNVTGTLSVVTGELSVELGDNRTVAVDEQVEFSPQSVENATGDVTYEWTFGDGASASSETVNHTYDTTGEYVVNLTVTDETNDTANASTTVTVTEPPAIESVNLTDVTDGNGIVVPGDTIEVAANVSGNVDTVVANLSAFDAGTVDLSESGSVYETTVQVGENPTDGNWSANVTATGEVGDNASAHTNTLEVDTDELVVALPDSRTVQLGKTYEYSPKSVENAAGHVTYNWTFGGTDKSGKSVDYTFDSTGTYTVELNASDGSRDTANTSMTVSVEDDSPVVETATIADATDGNGIVVPGDSIAVTANVTGDVDAVRADLSAFGANDSVELTHAGGDTYNRTVEVGENAVDGDQSALVTATDSQGNADSVETANLTVDTEVLDVALNDSRTVTVGEEIQFSPKSVANATGDVAYNWTFGDDATAAGKTVNHTYDSAGSYTVELTATDESGDVANASMAVDASGTPVIENVTLTDATDGNGIVAPGDSIAVTANVTGDVDAVRADLSAFDAGTVNLTLESSGNYHVTVDVGASPTDGTQSATVTASDAEGNEVTADTNTLEVDTDVLDVALNDSRTVRADGAVEFSPKSVANATGDVAYNWTFGDGATAAGKTVNHTYDSAGSYTVELTATDESGDVANAAVNVTVEDDVPTVESARISDRTNANSIVAPGDTVAVTANVTGDVGIVTANLSAFGANDSVELTHVGGDTYNRTVEVGENAVDGEHRVDITATNGQVERDVAATRALTVDTELLVAEVDDSRTVDVGDVVQYSPRSVNNTTGSVEYEWTFGGRADRIGRTVTYAFDSVGTYEVTLTASDGSNDTARTSMRVEVVSDSTDDSDDGGDWTDSATTEATQTATTEATQTATATPTATERPSTPTERTPTTERMPTPTEATTEVTPSGDSTVSGGETTIEQTPGEAPGFGVVGAVLALVAAAALTVRDRR